MFVLQVSWRSQASAGCMSRLLLRLRALRARGSFLAHLWHPKRTYYSAFSLAVVNTMTKKILSEQQCKSKENMRTCLMNGIMLRAKLSPLGVPRMVRTTLPAVSFVSPLNAAKELQSTSHHILSSSGAHSLALKMYSCM